MRTTLRVIVRVLALVVLLSLVVFGVTAARVVRAGRTDQARTADVLIVLGAAQFDGRPQDYLLARLEHARDLYQAGTSTRVLTLGGKQPGDRFTEADAGQTWLVAHGVPQDHILRIGEGSDTLGSIKAAATTMKEHGWSSAVVVTDPWHELRSTAMLSDQGISAYGSPTQTGPSVAGSVRISYIGRETAGYLYYELFRWLP